MDIKIAALHWTGNNIGDDVQSVAVMRHLPPVDIFLNRDDLNSYDGPPALLVMNGWFLTQPQNWPPSDAIKPIFFGFHVQETAKAAIARHADYLRKHQPIGCRDSATVAFIRSLEVEAYLSYCATLTFDAPADRAPDSLYLVEASLRDFDPKIRKSHGLIVKEASHRFIDVPHATRMQYASEMIATYGRKAAMVITSRIHCAMPCLAMGIPTMYIGPRTYRTAIVEEAGLVRHQPSSSILPTWLTPKHKEWPKPLDIQELKGRVKADLTTRIKAILNS